MDVEPTIKRLSELSPPGYLLVVRMGFFFPVFERNTMPQKWVDRYTSRGFMIDDPAMKWVYGNTGAARWSEMSDDDPREVFAQARLHGLTYGLAISHLDDATPGQRSIGSFARSDREFTDDEVVELTEVVRIFHDELVPPRNLTEAELVALRMVKNGLLMKEIANLIGVSEGAVKLRLRNAKTKLRAKTSTQAATLATSFGLI